MAELSLFCVVIYTLSSLVVGTRLISRARRSRGVPELLMGLTYLFAPGLGYPIAIAGPLWGDRGMLLASITAGELLIVVGCSCFLLFNAKVFRPGVGWALALACAGIVAISAGGGYVVHAYFSTDDAALATQRANLGTAAMVYALGVGYAWTVFEGLRYHRLMRRRLALGLAEPIVANRFLLWGCAGLVSMIWNSISGYYLMTGANIVVDPVPILATSLGGVVGAALQVLIFMPPGWYTRWVVRESRQRALATA